MLFTQRCNGVKAVASPFKIFKILEMFTSDTIDVFEGLIGWRQNYLNTGTQLTGLTTSESGMFYNDVSGFLSFDNLVAIAPHFKDTLNNDAAQVNEAFTKWMQDKTRSYIIECLNEWKGLKANRSKCDYNAFVIEHKERFVNMIYYKVGIKFLLLMAENPELKINRLTNSDYETNILFSIHGDTTSNKKQEHTLARMYKIALNSFCIPKRTRGIKVGAM